MKDTRTLTVFSVSFFSFLIFLVKCESWKLFSRIGVEKGCCDCYYLVLEQSHHIRYDFFKCVVQKQLVSFRKRREVKIKSASDQES